MPPVEDPRTETLTGLAPAGAGYPVDGGRFLPGVVIASRYRMAALLGKGGMGEVYRADDVKLGQAVALKFLPATVERDPDRLHRFMAEVRVALKVTHPSVCRVFGRNSAKEKLCRRGIRQSGSLVLPLSPHS